MKHCHVLGVSLWFVFMCVYSFIQYTVCCVGSAAADSVQQLDGDRFKTL